MHNQYFVVRIRVWVRVNYTHGQQCTQSDMHIANASVEREIDV